MWLAGLAEIGFWLSEHDVFGNDEHLCALSHMGARRPRIEVETRVVSIFHFRHGRQNPPLLVVSDLERIEVRTNFTNLSPKLYLVTLDDLAGADPSEALRVLRAVFTDPEALRPHFDRAHLSEEAARWIAELAGALQSRGHEPRCPAPSCHGVGPFMVSAAGRV